MSEKDDLDAMERIDQIIEDRRADITDKNLKDYVQFLFLRNTLLVERTATKIKELLAKTDAETAGKFKDIIEDIDTLKKGIMALEVLSADIGIIKADQKEIGKDIKSLTKKLGFEDKA